MLDKHTTLRLIREVFAREPLWNSQHRMYQNRSVTRKLWEETGQDLEIPADQALSRWKGLRDTLRREIKKHPLPPENTPSSKITSKWFYYKHLLFLRGHIRSPHLEESASNNDISLSNSLENLPDDGELLNGCVLVNLNTAQWTPTKQEANCSDRGGEEVKVDPSSCCPIEGNIISGTETHDNTFSRHSHGQLRRVKRKRNTMDDEDSDYATLKQKVVTLHSTPVQPCSKGSDEDDDWHFFQSLLPTVKTLPVERKFLLRMQIQELVYREVFSHSQLPATTANLGPEDSDSTATR